MVRHVEVFYHLFIEQPTIFLCQTMQFSPIDNETEQND
jgi:hypothetical protein